MSNEKLEVTDDFNIEASIEDFQLVRSQRDEMIQSIISSVEKSLESSLQRTMSAYNYNRRGEYVISSINYSIINMEATSEDFDDIKILVTCKTGDKKTLILHDKILHIGPDLTPQDVGDMILNEFCRMIGVWLQGFTKVVKSAKEVDETDLI